MTLEEGLRAQVAALREALTKAQGLIAANRLVLGEYAGVRHVLRLEGEVDSALSDTARAAAEHDERVREEGKAAGIVEDWEACWDAYAQEDDSKLAPDAIALKKAMRVIVERVRREALEEAVRAVEDTDVAEMGRGYTRCDDGRQTLRNAVDAIRALAAEPKGTP